MGKTIWILNHYASIPLGKLGFRHDSFAAELVKRGYDVYIFFSGFSHVSKTSRLNKHELFRHEVRAGVNYISIKTFPYTQNNIRRIINMISFVFNMLRIYKRFKKPDTVVASSVHPFTWIAGWLIAKRLQCRYIVEVRDLWPQTLIELGVIAESSLIAKALRLIERFSYRRADKIISVLPYAYKYISEFAKDDSDIVYIPNGVDVRIFNSLKDIPTDESESILREHTDCLKLLYTGSHDNTDALEVIIDAAKIIQDKGIEDIHFILVGNGVKKEELISRCRRLGLHNVFFYKPIPKEAIPCLLTHADCCLVSLYELPIYKYGISLNKIFDYMISGKPVIMAVDAGNNFIEEANCGISLPSSDCEKFADAVEEIYNLSSDERERLGTNGSFFVQKHHDIPVLVDKLEKLI